MSREDKQEPVGSAHLFKPVSSRASFPNMELDILKLWRDRDVFHRTESERQGMPLFVMNEGPPTANGSPGIHHVLPRVFKDCIPRYKTMKGYRVLRKGGWDTHGLPVELEVEKELGLSTKQDVEGFGVEEFNRRCRESVFRYVKEWEDLTERIAFWVDTKSAYATLTNDYIETGWWILRQLWDHRAKDAVGVETRLLFNGFKVTPHCPRCVTSLSSHEVALGYREDTQDPSIYVKFQVDLDSGPANSGAKEVEDYVRRVGGPAYLLAWTTTPWTLPGNVTLAVNTEAEYALVSTRSDEDEDPTYLILAKALLERALKGDYDVEATFKGSALVGLRYHALYDPFEYDLPQGSLGRFAAENILVFPEGTDQWSAVDGSWQVHPADYVTLEDGTGIVHTAPAFGADDYGLGGRERLLFIQSVNLQGVFEGSYPFAGKFVKDADRDIRRDLRTRGLLYRDEVTKHTYPFCWRCGTPLLYYAKSSWYIRTTAVKERLVSANQEISWYPQYIKEGRFGEWLQNNVDWAVSRERFWGTPIPIWRCVACSNEHCIGSVDEIRQMAHVEAMKDEGSNLEELLKDLHRPYVDRVLVQCGQCGGAMRRVPEVLDAWFDSGAMPFAQWHYPFENETIPEDGRYPADYICEAMDQTRGWFYSLHALAALLEKVTSGKITAPSYRNVICLGLVQDGRGEKMSKSRGNVVEPWTVIEAHGVDALRWCLYTAAPPGNSRRFSQDLVGEAVRRFLLTMWNTYSFFVTYANIDRFHPAPSRNPEPSSELDRWILSELNSLIAAVTADMDDYNPTDACRRIEDFVEGLSNWYVRRSRRRFWKSENDDDKLAAHSTLYHCLVTLCKLIAPLTPFVAEEMYQNLVRSVDPSAPESVHLARFPEADQGLINTELSEATRLAMRLSSLGRSARSKARIKVRQPIARTLVKLRSAQETRYWPNIKAQVEEELNLKEASLVEDPREVARFFDLRLNMALVGPRFGSEAGEVSRAFAQADQAEVYERVSADSPVKAGGYTLQADEIDVSPSEVEGYAVAAQAGYLVAVETSIPDDLRREGLARELVHHVQNMRRSANFEIADYIVTYYQGERELADVVKSFADYLKQETLSDRLLEQAPSEGAYVEDLTIEGSSIRVGVERSPRDS